MTDNILQRILATKAEEVQAQKSKLPLAEVKAKAQDSDITRPFIASITNAINDSKPAVIAEIKKASPSRGVLRQVFKPAEIAEGYEREGACCLSVLTDTPYFQGSNEHLQEARVACNLPVLRKDFMLDDYQIYEARLIGADCILLIVAALSDMQMQDMVSVAMDMELDVLLEVHNREELERAMMLRTPLIGINNRNLHTFEVDINTTLDLLIDVYHDRIVVAESGIKTREDVKLLRKHGVNAFLVGEAFMQAPDPSEALKHLFYI